jgi:hypothetical protein
MEHTWLFSFPTSASCSRAIAAWGPALKAEAKIIKAAHVAGRAIAGKDVGVAASLLSRYEPANDQGTH